MPIRRYNSVKPTLPFLALASLSLNRQDAKNAKQSEETTKQAEISLASSVVKATSPIK